jgi:DNA-binding FadR family transcriptional regulator
MRTRTALAWTIRSFATYFPNWFRLNLGPLRRGHAVNTAQVSLADLWEVRRTFQLGTVELAAMNRTD